MADLDFTGAADYAVLSQALNAIATQSGVRGQQIASSVGSLGVYFHVTSDVDNYDINFTKYFSSTAMRVDMGMSVDNTTGLSGTCDIAVRIGELTYYVSTMRFTGTSGRTMVSGVQLITGITAGTYVCKPQWRNSSGTNFVRETGSTLWLTIREVRG